MDGRPPLAVVGNSLRRGFGPPQPVGHETGQKGPFEISVAAKWDYCGFSRRPEWLQWWTLVLVELVAGQAWIRALESLGTACVRVCSASCAIW